MQGSLISSRPRSRWGSMATMALAIAAVFAAAGCGGGHARHVSVLSDFPGRGYRTEPPHLPRGLADNAVVVVDMTNAGRVRPTGLRFASDATLSRARWTDWGASTTTARGLATVWVCTSSCGAGHATQYPATMVLTGIRSCGHARYYERARVKLTTVAGSRPWGAFLRVPC